MTIPLIYRRWLGGLLALLIGLTILTYVRRNPTGDDAWFAEQSYWLYKTGVIRSTFFTGVLKWDVQLLVSHKLLLVAGAGAMHLFGPTLIAVQAVGLFFFLVLVTQLTGYVCQREKSFWSPWLLGLFLLVFSNRLLIKMSFENRPEIMVAALGFGSFLLLNKTNPTPARLLAAGAMAGLAMLTHLNGVIFLLAGAGMLIRFGQFRQFLLFGLASGAVGSLYFADVLLCPDGFALWQHQFRNDPATQNAFGIGPKLQVMLTFPKLFFYTPETAALPALLLAVGFAQRRLLRQLPVRLTTYSLLLVGAFWLITKSSTGPYSLLFMPLMLVLLYELYKLRPFRHWSLSLVLVAHTIIGIYGLVEIARQNLTQPYLPDLHTGLRNHIPARAKGAVPILFFFNDYERYDHLIAYDSYRLQHKPAAHSPLHLANWAQRQGLDFLLFDYKNDAGWPWAPPQTTTTLGAYQRTFADGQFAIFRLLPAPNKLGERGQHSPTPVRPPALPPTTP
jgi:hypothetical protein